MASQARNHHFVPQYYLKLFSEGKSRNSNIFVTDTKKGSVFETCPRNIGAVRDFNRIEAPGVEIDALEKALSGFDNKVAPVLKQIARNQLLPQGYDLTILVNFVALLLVRVPAARDLYRAFHERLARETGRLLVSDENVYRSVMEKVRKQEQGSLDVAADTYEDAKQFFESGDYELFYPPGYFLAYEMEMIDAVLHPLFRMSWHLLVSSSEVFVCSDRPVSVVSGDPNHRGPVGLAMPHAELLLPLARDMALLGEYRGRNEGRRPVSDEIVTRINGITVANAGRHIYSPKRIFRYHDGRTTKDSTGLTSQASAVRAR